MKALEEMISKNGKVLPGNILKVGSFLNHSVDTVFMAEMAEEVLRLYKGEKITKVLTVEASGIPFAFAIASALKVPMVYAKKKGASNIEPGAYSASVHSFTHGNDYEMVISPDVLCEGDSVLLADDFLAMGSALAGLAELAGKAGAHVVGAAIVIEKGFQQGREKLAATGLRVESLAIIESMDPETGIVYRPQ